MQKHATATIYIIAEISSKKKVLLHKHKKLGIWIGIGGHVEPDENPLEAAYREAREEINREITILHNQTQLLRTDYMIELPLPLGLFEFSIPVYGDEPAHKHIDFTYAATTQNPESVTMPEEFGWFSQKQLGTLPLEVQVVRNVLTALKIYESISTG